jgi:hypothetical protein
MQPDGMSTADHHKQNHPAVSVSSTLVLCRVGITHFEDVLRFELLQVKPDG